MPALTVLLHLPAHSTSKTRDPAQMPSPLKMSNTRINGLLLREAVSNQPERFHCPTYIKYLSNLGPNSSPDSQHSANIPSEP